MNKKYDITGKQFGYLTVIERDVKTIGERNAKWVCKCECGNYSIATYGDLRRGHTTSCGCKKYESHNKTHGKTNTRIYKIWAHIKTRCTNPNFAEWEQYGGRGISICDEWNSSFESFFEWAISNGYSDELTIERIDVNKNYEPNNCKWITLKEQQRNKTNTVFVVENGIKISLSELAEKHNIPFKTVKNRYYRNMERKGYVDIQKLIAPIQREKTSFRYRK